MLSLGFVSRAITINSFRLISCGNSVIREFSDGVPRRKFKPFAGTGDSGTSQLFNGETRPKSDSIFEALGATDELNSQLGVCRVLARSDGLFELESTIHLLQCCIQDAGSAIATPQNTSTHRKIARTTFESTIVNRIDGLIDEYDKPLPKLKTFILPGGTALSAQLQLARSVCRRAERRVSPLAHDNQTPPQVLQFFNRTSDLLFVLARYSNYVQQCEEVSYTKP